MTNTEPLFMPVTQRSTESELIDAARRGAPDAIAALYRRHAGVLLALARRLTGSAADGEDVLHDVFLGLPEALGHYEERGSIEAWLRRITARVALTRLRTAGRRREVALESAPERSRTAEAESFGDRALLEHAIAALPDRLRVVFVLREVEGHSHAQIGALLGISVAASEVRLCRAIKVLREQLRNHR